MSRNISVLRKAVCLLLAVILMVTALPQSALLSQAAGYSIKINRATNVVTVYKGDKAVKAMACSTGGSNTPLGEFSAGQKYRWQVLDGPCYGQYCTRITGHVLFHSVWYYSYDLDSQSTVQYNKLGTTASHGCVRLTVADAKWIYDNISSGTKITIFSGSEDDDPLGKPKTIKVSTASSRGWDPTDPDPNNPYKALRPSIDISKVKGEGAHGKKSNYKSAVTATDSGGGDISDEIKISGKVNTKKIGTYKIVYKVTDALGHTGKKSVKIKVVDKSKAKIEGIESPMEVEIGTKVNLKENITVTAVDGKDLKKKTTVSVKLPESSKYKELSSASYTFKEEGDYIVKYTVTNPRNGKVTTRRMRVEVTNSGAPEIEGFYDEEDVVVGDTVDLMEDVTATTVDGTDVTDTMTLTITLPDESVVTPEILLGRCDFTFDLEGKYTIVYTATNPETEATATETAIYTATE